jgi:hypothetical protein
MPKTRKSYLKIGLIFLQISFYVLNQGALDCNALDPVVLSKVFERGIVGGVDLLIIR